MMPLMGAILILFLSTLSLRRATVKLFRQNYECFISIHALLAESDDMAVSYSKGIKISIHALLAESDALGWYFFGGASDFYPRSPCGERPWQRGSRATYVEFLSTLSLRRAT